MKLQKEIDRLLIENCNMQNIINLKDKELNNLY